MERTWGHREGTRGERNGEHHIILKIIVSKDPCQGHVSNTTTKIDRETETDRQHQQHGGKTV